VENLDGASVDVLNEADNDTIAVSHPYEASYTGVAAVATTTPSATQKINSLTGLNSGVAHGGSDTLEAMYGQFNSAFVRGAYTETVFGVENNIGIGATAISNVGSMFGIANVISYPAGGTPHVLGPLYGYYFSQSANMPGRVDGPAYGFYTGNITASSFSNWAVYTNKGANRFGDSLTITDGLSSARPRAILDVNSSSGMIIPTGTTVQRPATAYAGMIRYNTDNASAESFNGSVWTNMKSPVIAITAAIDPPFVAAASTATIGVIVPGAAIGNTVTVSFSPTATIPNGYFIAWARVTSANNVQIAFGNMTNAAIDLGFDNYAIKVIQ
jgi:hypothetical protein